MSKKLPSEELSWEEAVCRYLEDNPDYFQRHLDVLSGLFVPHPDHGGAISLIERQVQVLREQNAAAQAQLRDLVGIARQNDMAAERLHHFAIAMIDAGSLEDVFDTTRDLLRQEFSLDAVVTLLKPAPVHGIAQRPEFARAEDPQFEALFARCEGKRVVCTGKLDSDAMRYLFAAQAPEIKSLALIPLKDASRTGLLCLASGDGHRFHPEMGVIFLLRIGELFMRAVARFLNRPHDE